jgi:uncharacterized protein (DUF2235 family)
LFFAGPKREKRQTEKWFGKEEDNVPASDESVSEETHCRNVTRSWEKIEREKKKKKKKKMRYETKMNRSQTIQRREAVLA